MGLTFDVYKELSSFPLDIHTNFQEGITALLGSSGSGKSMTLKCISGLERPDCGRILLGDRVLFDSEAKINIPTRHRKVGMLFQGYSLFPNMTVAENIAAGLRMGESEKRKIINHYLEAFHLEDLAQSKPNRISGGQAQRVALARMLATNPDTILLDEPFSALDASLKWQIEEHVSDLLKDRPGVSLVVTHDRDEAYRMADQIVVIDRGHIVFHGPKKELMENPRTKAAAQMSGCKNITAAKHQGSRALLPAFNFLIPTMKAEGRSFNYVGIRAHFFQPCTDPEDPYRFRALIERVTESPFHWLIYMRPLMGEKPSEDIVFWILDKHRISPLTGGEHQKAWLDAHRGQALDMTLDPRGLHFLED